MVEVEKTSRSREEESSEDWVEEDRLLAVCYDVELSNTLCVLQQKVVEAELVEEGRIEGERG